MKNIAIIGSTGSIGTQTLDIVRANSDLKIVALAAGSNVELLERQAREFKPEIIGIWSEDKADVLRDALSCFHIRVVSGMEGLIEIAGMSSADILVTAIVGMIGIRPTVEAIKAGKDIALANKETLVTAGEIIMPLAKKHGVKILPVDSEHSAILQCIHGENLNGVPNKISRILITASGGPFLGRDRAYLENVTLEDALKHPNWSMGKKITIDSATMANKGLEIIEAHFLFNVDYQNIKVILHRESIIHSMVEFNDSSIIAQLGTPDMRVPIQYALTYPDRIQNKNFKEI